MLFLVLKHFRKIYTGMLSWTAINLLQFYVLTYRGLSKFLLTVLPWDFPLLTLEIFFKTLILTCSRRKHLMVHNCSVRREKKSSTLFLVKQGQIIPTDIQCYKSLLLLSPQDTIMNDTYGILLEKSLYTFFSNVGSCLVLKRIYYYIYILSLDSKIW